MGIRTVGYEKGSLSAGERKSEPQNSGLEDTVLGGEKAVSPAQESKVFPLSCTSPLRKKILAISTSPDKLKNHSAMARLGGIKVAARKLKKHRKRSLFVASTNKILRASVKSNNKPKRPCRPEDKPNGNIVLPSRISTRTCVRRSSREGIAEAPLRTVELIKRPLELREPATKLLYLASLGLYPRTGESDMTPIVVIKEVCASPGKKNGARKSMELPLIPYHRRYLDLANQDKRSFSENVKPMNTQQSYENRKSPQVSCDQNETSRSKQNEGKAKPTKITPAPNVSISSTNSSRSSRNDGSDMPKQSIPPARLNGIHPINLNTASTPANIINLINTTSITKSLHSVPFEKEASTLNPKSLLRNNNLVQALTNSAIKDSKFNTLLNLSNLSAKLMGHKAVSPDTTSTSSNVTSTTNAMNLIMSNITIIPRPCPITNDISGPLASRKRAASSLISELKPLEHGSLLKQTVDGILEYTKVNVKPPIKKQKLSATDFKLSNSPPPTKSPVNIASFLPQSNFLLQPAFPQNPEEALNLCVKNRAPDKFVTASRKKLPPKLKFSPNSTQEQQKSAGFNGPIALNLIIPRPPPLTKAPLEITNIANGSQNVLPLTKIKKKKARQSKNLVNGSNIQLQCPALPAPVPLIPPLPAVVLPPETTVHAKSLLKCMNGEENICAREIGESLDSVKTMLARLQTRIGPAVNGVRLITIE